MAEFNGEAFVLKAGVNANQNVEVMLKNLPGAADQFENFYTAPDGLKREYLAIALSAITSDRRVYCHLGNYSQAGSAIGYFGMVK